MKKIILMTAITSAVGFYGCSKPNNSTTNGKSDSPAEITITPNLKNISADRQDGHFILDPVVIKSNKQDQQDATISIAEDQLPSGWAVDGANACESAQYGSSDGCKINLKLDASVSTDGSQQFSIPFTLKNSSAKVTTSNIAYRVLGLVTVANQFNEPFVRVVGSSQVIPFNISFSFPKLSKSISMIQFVSLSDTDNWKFNEITQECGETLKNYTPPTDSPCKMKLTFQPTVAKEGTLNLKYSYIVNNGITQTDVFKIPYQVLPKSKLLSIDLLPSQKQISYPISFINQSNNEKLTFNSPGIQSFTAPLGIGSQYNVTSADGHTCTFSPASSGSIKDDYVPVVINAMCQDQK